MSPLRHIVEPESLLLTWQPPDESAQVRTRRVVGEVCKDTDGKVVFRYLKDSFEFQAALTAGFKGYPAFPLEQVEVRHGVIESLMRRLPPRKREDFDEYLAQHRLPIPFNYSDFALLGYTGARLPSDGFGLVPVFGADSVPCDFLLEVAGLRHVFTGELDNIKIGDPVTFEVDTTNPVDNDALAVFHRGRKVGYVNRALRRGMTSWIRAHRVTATVDRLNGKPERPLLYVMVNVT